MCCHLSFFFRPVCSFFARSGFAGVETSFRASRLRDQLGEAFFRRPFSAERETDWPTMEAMKDVGPGKKGNGEQSEKTAKFLKALDLMGSCEDHKLHAIRVCLTVTPTWQKGWGRTTQSCTLTSRRLVAARPPKSEEKKIAIAKMKAAAAAVPKNTRDGEGDEEDASSATQKVAKVDEGEEATSPASKKAKSVELESDSSSLPPAPQCVPTLKLKAPSATPPQLRSPAVKTIATSSGEEERVCIRASFASTAEHESGPDVCGASF